LFWGLGLFVAAQLALTAVMERWRPELRDPEYGFRLAHLRNLLAKNPGRPLVLALGSSRTQLGFRPSALRWGVEFGDRAPVAFNCALVGAGPLTELLCLNRLLRHGVRPAVLLVEILPSRLCQEGPFTEDPALRGRLGWEDWPSLRGYLSEFDRDYWYWRRHQLLTPCYTQRFHLLSTLAPTWLPAPVRHDGWWEYTDRTGWMARRENVSPAEYRHALEHAHREVTPILQQFRLSAAPDRALHEILDVCRQEGIAPVLVLMPEGTEFQSWYPSAVRAAVEAYLAGLSREYGAPLVDARSWIADDCFADSHHLLVRGADLFTERLGRQVLRPLLQAPGTQVNLTAPPYRVYLTPRASRSDTARGDLAEEVP
jgi:hypothetical protein